MILESNPLSHRVIRALFLFVPIALVLFLIYDVGEYTYRHHIIQRDLQAALGERWQEEYEGTYGPLADHQQKTAIGLGSILLVSGLVFGIYRMTRPRPAQTSKRRKRKRQKSTTRPAMPAARRAHLVPK